MRITPYSFGVGAIAALLAFGVAVAQEIGAPSETVIVTVDCEQAWHKADAALSCTTTVLAAERAPGSSIVNNCAVKANCASTAGGQHDTFSDYHGGPAGVETLVNGSVRLTTGC